MRISRLFDGIDTDGRPRYESRKRVSDPAEKERILSFLSGGGLIRAANGRSRDQVDPSRGNKVPRTFRTDGQWIWTGATRYYLEHYGIAPEAEFLTYIESREYYASLPDADTIALAVRMLADRRG